MPSSARVRSFVKGSLPPSMRRLAREVRLAVRFGGLRFHCPCCGGRWRRMLPYGVARRPDAQCPRCGAVERHRTLWRYLTERAHFPAAPAILHIAPEPVLQTLLRRIPGVRYVSGDLSSRHTAVRMDLTALPCRSATFDGILCVHVLEHIPDDRAAMRELFRVLKPGGWAILQTPFDPRREVTYEDPSIVTPEERLGAFGQHDHVRIYGRDLVDRLTSAGFDVTNDDYVRHVRPQVIARERLASIDILLCGRRS